MYGKILVGTLLSYAPEPKSIDAACVPLTQIANLANPINARSDRVIG